MQVGDEDQQQAAFQQRRVPLRLTVSLLLAVSPPDGPAAWGPVSLAVLWASAREVVVGARGGGLVPISNVSVNSARFGSVWNPTPYTVPA